MGEYARQYTLDTFGVDIGDSDDQTTKPRPPKPLKRFGCSCGKAFLTLEARTQHQQATGHGPSKREARHA